VRGFGEVRGRLATPLEETRGEMWEEEVEEYWCEEGGDVEEEEEEEEAAEVDEAEVDEDAFPLEVRLEF
jgi:hypothetical protein